MSACHYESLVPHELSAFDEPFPADLMGVLSDAKRAVSATTDPIVMTGQAGINHLR